jgi:adenylate cyclase
LIEDEDGMLRGVRKRLDWRGALSGALAAVAAWLLVQAPVIRGLEEWMLDGCFYFRGPRPTQAKVVLIALDDDSIDELNKPLTFTSPELARVVRYAREQGAAAIGLDLIVPESLAGLPELQEGSKQGDATELGKAVREAGNVVLAQWRLPDGWRRPLPQWRLKNALNPQPTDLGFVNLTEDDDNFVRRQQLYVADDGREHMHFALALFARAAAAEVSWGEDGLRVGGERVALEDQKLRINFVGPPGSFPVLSFRDVLAAAKRDRPTRVSLAGAIVIIGVTAPGQGDVHATPYANNYWRNQFSRTPGLMSGTELHANIVATLHDRAYIVPQRWLSSLAMLLVFGVVLGLGFALLNRIRGAGTFFLATFAVFAVHHFAWKWVCVEAFRHGHWRIEMLAMLFLGLFAWLGNFGVRWLSLRHILKVVSGPFGGVLEADPGRLGLGGEERVVTVLFADVRSFSQFSQQQPARNVVALLNRYFTAVVPVLERHGGTVNQFLGDGIMVLFGAPSPNEDHAAAAVRAAVDMVRRVHELRATWEELGCPGFRIGVGIHTGPVIVGSVGSPRRLTYTAIGDTVNAAARIEPENKTFKSEILISAATYQYLPAAERGRLGCAEEPLTVELRGVGTLNLYPVRPG